MTPKLTNNITIATAAKPHNSISKVSKAFSKFYIEQI
jgi:hypothetical protein